MNCWAAWVCAESMPVTAEPDRASAVMAWLPPPVRPRTADRVQVDPSAEVQTAASRAPPAAPNCAAAVKPPGPPASAVTLTPGPGELNGTGCQARPPSADTSASGRTPFAVTCWPSAVMRVLLTATCWIHPAEAPAASGMFTVVQARPSFVVHTAGLPSWEPAETKPEGPAATASTWLEPPAWFTS